MNTATSLRFSCFTYAVEWHAPSYEAKVETHGIAFFSDENGFEPADLAAVRALWVGRSVALDGGAIVVTRQADSFRGSDFA